tara:strand:+ start:32706 stop:33845 length:1140 start_codon:yes stop_codon:yes gene_type:complete
MILVLFALVACNNDTPQESAEPPSVTVATPIAKNVTDWDEFTGRLAAVDTVEVRARVSGYVESVVFKEGAMVDEGELLYVIDSRPYQAALAEAKAQADRASVQLELASKDQSRVQRLFETHAISEEEFDTKTQEKRAAEATLQAARAAEQAAQLDVEFTRIKAPIPGRISRTHVTEGNLISGGTAGSMLLTTIVSLDPIHFYFTGTERDFLQYLRLDKAGVRSSSRDAQNPVRLKLADEENFVHEGHMDFVDNQIDEATGTMLGRAVFPNPDNLLVPGMFAEIELLGDGPYKALLIPDEAIGADQMHQFVYVVDENNVAQRRVIEPDRLEDGLRVIRKGLTAGDRVVINGIQRVHAGAPVTLKTADVAQLIVTAAGEER